MHWPWYDTSDPPYTTRAHCPAGSQFRPGTAHSDVHLSHVCDGQAVAYQLLKIDIVNIALTSHRNRSNIKASLTQSINCNHLGLRTSYKTFTKSSICGTFRTQLYAVGCARLHLPRAKDTASHLQRRDR